MSRKIPPDTLMYAIGGGAGSRLVMRTMCRSPTVAVDRPRPAPSACAGVEAAVEADLERHADGLDQRRVPRRPWPRSSEIGFSQKIALPAWPRRSSTAHGCRCCCRSRQRRRRRRRARIDVGAWPRTSSCRRRPSPRRRRCLARIASERASPGPDGRSVRRASCRCGRSRALRCCSVIAGVSCSEGFGAVAGAEHRLVVVERCCPSSSRTRRRGRRQMTVADLRRLDQPPDGLVRLGPLEPVLGRAVELALDASSAAVSIQPGLTRLTRIWWRISE